MKGAYTRVCAWYSFRTCVLRLAWGLIGPSGMEAAIC